MPPDEGGYQESHAPRSNYHSEFKRGSQMSRPRAVAAGLDRHHPYPNLQQYPEQRNVSAR